MTITDHAKLLRGRYSNADLHRIQIQAQRDGFKTLCSAVTLAMLIGS